MKKRFIPLFAALLIIGQAIVAAELSEEYQQDLLDRLNYLHGKGPLPVSLENAQGIPHCGTSIAFEVFINKENFTGAYKSLISQVDQRPELPWFYVSPSGYFKIHYAVSGVDAVYQPTVVGGDGIPDYVNKVADIADSVRIFEIDSLGYPVPPKDGFYLEGGDSLYDIYIVNLGSFYYGATQGERTTITSNQSATSYITIDNNFNFEPYTNRPLDAVRVTLAHEFFHAIHFGMDYTEYDGTETSARLYWWEMSATWMEETMYDDINDYYGYLPYFFDYPWVGLVHFSFTHSPLDLHPYGAAVFPIFLTEKYGRDIIHSIWEKCRDYGVGPQFLKAADSSIAEFSGGEYHLRDAFQEFAVWNLFTGSRVSRAPAGLKYSEAQYYPVISEAVEDSIFITHDKYPFLMLWGLPNGWPDSMNYYENHTPQNLGSNYINLTKISLVEDSLKLIFFGRKYQYDEIKWNLTTVVYPILGSMPAEVKFRTQLDSGNIVEKWVRPDSEIPGLEINNIIFIPTATSLVQGIDSKSFGFSYEIRSDSSKEDTTPDTLNFIIAAPYPNPVSIDSVVFSAVFSANKPWLYTDPPAATLMVDIFNIVGEKIFELSGRNALSGVSLPWHLKNYNGREIASGIYFAICRLQFSDGSSEIIKKYKLAVIR